MDSLLAQASAWAPLETTFYTSSLLYALASPGPSSSTSTTVSAAAPIPFPSSLQPFYVAHSHLSGSIALLRNTSVPVPYTGPRSSAALHRGLGIYSSSGLPIVRFALDDTGDVGDGSSNGPLSQRPANWAHPVLLAFDRKGRLVVLEEGGRYRVYATNSATFSSHAIASVVLQQQQQPPQPAEGLAVAEAKAYPGGFVVRLNSGAFWDVPLEGGRLVPLALPPAAPAPANGTSSSTNGTNGQAGKQEAWCVIGADEAPLGVVTVYLSRGKTVYTLDRDEWVDQVRRFLSRPQPVRSASPDPALLPLVQRIDKGPFLKLLPSPSGRLLALLLPPTAPTSSSSANAFPSLWVVSSTFAQSHSTLPPLTLLGLDSPPSNQRYEQRKLDDAQWCANDSVVCSWSWTGPGGRQAAKLVVCGPGGGYLDYPSPSGEPPLLLPTPVGMSLLSANEHRFLSTVPYDLQQLVLATDPEPASAVLLQAHAHFLKGSPKSYGLLTQLRTAAAEGDGRETLKDGVRTLVSIAKDLTAPSSDAAESHHGVGAVQKQVLAAAAWGRGFLDEQARDGDEGVVEVGKGLRVLNALSDWKVGVPLSWSLSVHPSIIRRAWSSRLTLVARLPPQVREDGQAPAAVAAHVALAPPARPPARVVPRSAARTDPGALGQGARLVRDGRVRVGWRGRRGARPAHPQQARQGQGRRVRERGEGGLEGWPTRTGAQRAFLRLRRCLVSFRR